MNFSKYVIKSLLCANPLVPFILEQGRLAYTVKIYANGEPPKGSHSCSMSFVYLG